MPGLRPSARTPIASGVKRGAHSVRRDPHQGGPDPEFDETLGVAGRVRTVAARKAIALLGAEMPFMLARNVLKELTGIDMSDKTVLD